MGSRDFLSETVLSSISFAFCKQLLNLKMSEAQDAFIIFDEAYEGVDVDAFYLGDILRALGCKEDYVEGLKVFDKDGTGKVPLPEVKNVLTSLGEKLEPDEADKLCTLLGLVADDEDNISYMEVIDKLLAATA